MAFIYYCGEQLAGIFFFCCCFIRRYQPHPKEGVSRENETVYKSQGPREKKETITIISQARVVLRNLKGLEKEKKSEERAKREAKARVRRVKVCE